MESVYSSDLLEIFNDSFNLKLFSYASLYILFVIIITENFMRNLLWLKKIILKIKKILWIYK